MDTPTETHPPSQTPSTSIPAETASERIPLLSSRSAPPGVKFTTLNQDVLLYRPESDVPGSSNDRSESIGGESSALGKKTGEDDVPSPRVILLFGFMSASARSLGRWTSQYAQMHPQATIAIIKMRPGYFFVSEREQERALQPIYDLLMADIYSPELVKRESVERRGLLVHLLSSGGGFQFAVLARMLARRFASSSSPPPSFPYLQVHDSDPGQSSFKSVSAFTTPLASLPFPSPIIMLLRSIAWLPAVLVVGSTLAVYWVMNRTGGTDVAEIVDAGGKGGGRGVAFGGMRRWVRIGLPVGAGEGTGVPITRLYVYSDKDEQVSFRSVESHIAEVLSHLEPAGSSSSSRATPRRPESFLPNSSSKPHPQVRVEKYKGSKHMAHVKMDPERYWAAVKEMWGVAVGEVMRKGGAKL